MDEISGVLETLIKEGKVKKQVIGGGNPVYKLEREEL